MSANLIILELPHTGDKESVGKKKKKANQAALGKSTLTVTRGGQD